MKVISLCLMVSAMARTPEDVSNMLQVNLQTDKARSVDGTSPPKPESEPEIECTLPDCGCQKPITVEGKPCPVCPPPIACAQVICPPGREPVTKPGECCPSCPHPCPVYSWPFCESTGRSPDIIKSWKDENGCQKYQWEECPPMCPVSEAMCPDGSPPPVEERRTDDNGCEIIKWGDCPTPKCRKNEEHNWCGSACEPTCALMASEPPICTEQCVSGCFCKDGWLKNANGRCVRQKSKRCQREACKKGEAFYKCGTNCEPTCANPSPFCNKMCKLNTCQCPQGKLRRSDGKCVKAGNKKCTKEAKEAER